MYAMNGMEIVNPWERKGEKSGYLPSPEVVKLTEQVQRDYSFGHGLLTRTWIELNSRSVIDDENRGQLMFNAYVDESIDDPAEAWKWRGTRSYARNKGIAMHAQLTSKFVLAKFTAQNENDEIDQEYSEFMNDIVEWMAEPDVSDYQPGFLQAAFGMMHSPVTYLGAEYNEVHQKIRVRKEEDGGRYTIKEILDEELSGFRAPIYGPTEVLISNAYERNIQRQRSIIERRFVDKTELEAKYGNHPYWNYVKAGWKTVYNYKDGLFYDYYDIQHPLLVEEVIWKNRRQDIEVPFLGGIYMGAMNADGSPDTESNPIRHRDNRGAPRYNKVPFGYNRIGDHFFYYKSMMNVVGWDHMLYDAMTEMTMNRAMLEVDQPVAVYGADKDKIDSEIVFPKAVVAFEDPNTKLAPFLPPSNMNGAYEAMNTTKASMDEETLPGIMSGNLPAGSARGMAYVLSIATQNAEKIIGEVAKSLADSLAQYGSLMKDIAINHYTVPMVEELEGGVMRLKYKSFLLPNRQVDGKTVNKKIMFDSSLLGSEMSEEEKNVEALRLLEETNWPEGKQVLARVNPALFAKHNFLASTDIQEFFARNNQYWQPILTNLYTMLRQDPLADTEWLLHRLGHAYFNAEGDKLVKKQPTQVPGMPAMGGMPPPAPAGAPGAPKMLGAVAGQNNQLGQMAQSRALSTTMQPTPAA